MTDTRHVIPGRERRDPVCGMTVGAEAATVDGYPEFGFCSSHCCDQFVVDTERYTSCDVMPHDGRAEVVPAGGDPVHLSVHGMTPDGHASGEGGGEVSRGSHHHRFRPLMWAAIGVSFAAVAVATVLRLDPRIAGYVVGGLFVVCLAVCVLAYWLDARAGRASRNMFDQLPQRMSKGV